MKIFTRLALGLAWIGWSGCVAACVICAPSDAQNTLTQRLVTADAVVLATVKPGDPAVLWLQTFKGALPADPIVLKASSVQDAGVPQAAQSQVLLHHRATKTWQPAGALPQSRAPWLRDLMALGKAPEPSEKEFAQAWSKRLAFFAPDLQHPLDLVAQTAYEEVSVAPYAAMRTLKPHLVGKEVTRWLEDANLAARRPLYGLLLGIAADEAAAPDIERRLLASSPSQSGADLSALFAAYLEIRGDAGMAWLERHYLTNPQRSDAEIQAALLALNVHGNDGIRLQRERIVQAYAAFIQHNPARAGFVASNLGDWGHWEFGADYAALLQAAQPQVFSSRYAMVIYLMRSPKPEARAALEALRASGVL